MKKLIAVVCITLLSTCLWATEIALPSPQVPPCLVNDFAHILSSQERQALEKSLRIFDETTSSQIAVVTISSLQGLEINDYATRLFNAWGIGGEGKNNGVLLLILPKTAYQQGQAFISTGYGTEGVLPDAICYDIVNNEMIPYFRENNYFGGIGAAIQQIIPILKGEFTAEEYQKELQKDAMMSDIFDIVIVVVFLVILFISYRRGNKGGNSNDSNQQGGTSSGRPFIGGFFGPFGGGSMGGGGFSGGGFGGFGGGSSGGGGAGGRW